MKNVVADWIRRFPFGPCVFVSHETYFFDLFWPKPPIGTQKCLFFFARFHKMCSFRGLEKSVWSSVAPHNNQHDSFFIGSLRQSFSRGSASAACQISPGTATLDNMGCIAAHLSNWTLDRVNLMYPLQHHVYFFIPQDTSNTQLWAITQFSHNTPTVGHWIFRSKRSSCRACKTQK